jgi:DNA-binding HxlR family transcriptional regulator
MSRSMLIKRLRELERNGIVVVTPKPRGQGSTYALTDAGRDLGAVVGELAAWAERWVDVRPEHTDPGFALWVWVPGAAQPQCPAR